MAEDQELFEIFAGTYEEFLLGFKLLKNNNGELRLEQTVADHAHKGSVRTVNCAGGLLATGGSDELIHVYSLDHNREIGTLTQHTGTVTCLWLTEDEKHLISCSEDGSIAIYRIGSWVMEKLWTKAHNATSVNWVAVHPSNKMMLSLGNDGSLRTWNLVQGTQVFQTDISQLSRRPEMVVWSTEGGYFALPHDDTVSVFSVQTAKVIHEFTSQAKITSVHFIQERKVCTGDSGGWLQICNTETGNIESSIQIRRDIRIRSIACHDLHIVLATSQGTVMVLEAEGLREVATIETSCRITCITTSCHCHRKDKWRKKRKVEMRSEMKEEADIPSPTKPQPTVNSFKRKMGVSPRKQGWVVEEIND